MMSESLLFDCTKIILMIPSSTYSFTNFVQMSTCFVRFDVDMFLLMKMAPTLSTQTVMGSLTLIFMLSKSCSTNMISLTASDSATHSASLLLKVTLCCAFDRQLIGTPFTYKIKPDTLCLESGSPA